MNTLIGINSIRRLGLSDLLEGIQFCMMYLVIRRTYIQVGCFQAPKTKTRP